MSTTHSTTQNPVVTTTLPKYYSNARGVNYYPIIESQWKKSGYLPRLSNTRSELVFGGLAAYGFDTSNSFRGSNKTAMWWYYSDADNETCLKMLKGIGINCLRVFLDIYVWLRDRVRFIANLRSFMKLCDRLKLRVQLVIWDGINIESNWEVVPTSREQTLSGVETGLLSVWQRNPHHFEISSVSQANDFYTTCATPYLNDVCSSVSSFQSMWSVDLVNENSGNISGMSALCYSTSRHVSSMLSSINIAITFGHGNCYDQYYGELYGGGNSVYPNFINNLSGAVNFVSFHPYIVNTYATAREIVEHGKQGFSSVGRPFMYSELVDPHDGGYLYKLLEYFNSSLKMGGLSFDAMIDRSNSYEPFISTQGIFFADGTVRNLKEAMAYLNLASSTGWFSKRQFNTNITQKDISINNGADEGYWSGVVPIHGTFNSDLYTSTTEAKWNIAKTVFYTSLPQLGAIKYESSKNYPVYGGHPFQSRDDVLFINDGNDFEDFLSICSSYPGNFTPLADYNPSVSSGDEFIARNREIVLREQVLRSIITFLFHMGETQVDEKIIGTQYDLNYAPSALRLDLSAHYHLMSRDDGSSIELGMEIPRNSAGIVIYASAMTSGGIPCVRTGTCIYNTPGVSSTGINWAAYDTYYQTAYDKLNACLNFYTSSTDPGARLY